MTKFVNVQSDYNNIIFFDGVCNLCNGFVQFILKNDNKNQFYFTSLQSVFSTHFFQEYNSGIPSGEGKINSNVNEDYQSVYFYADGKLYQKSDAVLRIITMLNAPYSFLRAVRFLPLSIRNFIYDLVAKHRYKIMGKKDNCMVPSPQWKNKFI